jgi:hypothetical protein
MAVPSLDAFLKIFPELVIHPVPVIENALLVSGKVCAEEVWGDLHESGVGYYAAHLIDLRNREIGAMVGQPVSGITASRTNIDGVAATFYGQQYEALRLTLPLVGFTF